MNGLCNLHLNVVVWAAVAFLVAALAIGAISAFMALLNPAPKSETMVLQQGEQIAPILEALKGLIVALGAAPAWFALFLAGSSLFWLSGKVYVDACKPARPTTTINKTISETTTRTITAGPATVPPPPPQLRPQNRTTR